MDIFEGRGKSGIEAIGENFQGHARCGSNVGGLSERPAGDHRRRRASRRTGSRTEGCEGGGIFGDAHGFEICNSCLGALID